MKLNNLYLRQISLILHRSARSTIPAFARTCRFRGAKNDTNFNWNLTIPHFADMWPSQILLSPMVLDTFLFCFNFLHDRQASLPSLHFIMYQFLHTFPIILFFWCLPPAPPKTFRLNFFIGFLKSDFFFLFFFFRIFFHSFP